MHESNLVPLRSHSFLVAFESKRQNRHSLISSSVIHRRDLSNRIHEVANVNETVSTYTSRRNSSNSAISNTNSEPFEIAPHHVKWVHIIWRFHWPNCTTHNLSKVCTWLVEVLVQVDYHARGSHLSPAKCSARAVLGSWLNNICKWVLSPLILSFRWLIRISFRRIWIGCSCSSAASRNERTRRRWTRSSFLSRANRPWRPLEGML